MPTRKLDMRGFIAARTAARESNAYKQKGRAFDPAFPTHSTMRTKFFQQPRQGPPSTRPYNTGSSSSCQSPVLGTARPSAPWALSGGGDGLQFGHRATRKGQAEGAASERICQATQSEA